MRHHDPGGVGESKTTQEPTEDARGYRREGAKANTEARDEIEGRVARGHSQHFRHGSRGDERDGKMHRGGMKLPKPMSEFLQKRFWRARRFRLVRGRLILFHMIRF